MEDEMLALEIKYGKVRDGNMLGNGVHLECELKLVKEKFRVF